MAQIIIPSPLRKHTGGKREVQVKSSSLEDAMKELVASHPGLKRLFDRPALISVFINGSMLREKPGAWGSVSLAEQDEITLIIPIAGG